ncbi:MAG: 4-hydroxythreonine-4-phosphate dehydrogenase PdxA [Verrucomicrobiales bacterium]
MTSKVLAVSMGDPAGVGPELCLELLEKSDRPVVIFGSAKTLTRVAEATGRVLPENVVAFRQSDSDFQSKMLVDFDELTTLDQVRPGIVSAEGGRASFLYFEEAVRAALAKRVLGVVTGPINKAAWQAAGIAYPGHTEALADLTETTRYCMMLTCPELTCAFVTDHVGLAEVARLINVESVLETIELTAEAMEAWNGRPGKLLVLGLNPHAGEGGLMGFGEEETIIQPAMDEARRLGHELDGPFSPDTAFLQKHRQNADAYICMYHDQGLIPLKLLGFGEAVNVTLGLPIVRTSVGHGTAYDLAWKGTASTQSLLQAVDLAWRLACRSKDLQN